MRRMRYNKKRMYLIVICAVFVFMGVGYAYFSSSLSINGNVAISKNSWDVHFQNVIVTNGSANRSVVPTLSESNTKVTANISLNEPGDFYEFTVDVINNGSIDAMLSDISSNTLTAEQQNYLEYSLTYDDNTVINAKDSLKAGSSDTIKVRVKYKENIDESLYPKSDQSLTLTLQTTYIQDDGTSTSDFICKRATTLHTELCGLSSQGCYAAGYTVDGAMKTTTITYGNLGTDGKLASGDAFDCDVNGDGTYDSTTERFYYVSDLDANSKYAVLVYYNSVSGGLPSNTTTYVYNQDISGWLGPDDGILQLPTIDQWKRVRLFNTVRDIKDQTGVVRVEDFSYDGYSARFLTTSEVESACNITVNNYVTGELDSCRYLLENTRYGSVASGRSIVYGFWLESLNSNQSQNAWRILVTLRIVNHIAVNFRENAGNGYSVRPVIEVLKTKISY